MAFRLKAVQRSFRRAVKSGNRFGKRTAKSFQRSVKRTVKSTQRAVKRTVKSTQRDVKRTVKSVKKSAKQSYKQAVKASKQRTRDRKAQDRADKKAERLAIKEERARQRGLTKLEKASEASFKKNGVKNLGWLEIMKELDQANVLAVAVGVLAAEGAQQANGAEATVAEVATWNHFGTSTIPARPFITRPIDALQGEIAELTKRLLTGVSTGKLRSRQALGLLGQHLQAKCVQSINNREFAANATSTVASKGSDQPLVDTGQLKSSISYKVINWT